MVVQLTAEDIAARATLADAFDAYQETARWCTHNAYRALRQLHEDWSSACRAVDPAALTEFRATCHDLLGNCEALRMTIAQRAQRFAKSVSTGLPVLHALAHGDPDCQKLTQKMLDDWNETLQPNIVRLYEHVEQLEDSIHGTMNTMEQEVLS